MFFRSWNSGTSQESDDPQASESPMIASVEQNPVAPSPCSSPQSVLQQNFSVDGFSEFQQNIQMEVDQFDTTVENNMLDELGTGVSSEILSQSSMPLEDSTAHSHNDAYIEQESSHHQEKSTEEVDRHSDVDEPINYEDQMENLALCEDTGMRAS